MIEDQNYWIGQFSIQLEVYRRTIFRIQNIFFNVSVKEKNLYKENSRAQFRLATSPK